MASINTRYGKLQVDFRYKGQHCREQTRYADTPANRKKLEKIIERMEQEISLGIFVYNDYFPKSKKSGFFETTEKTAAKAAPEQANDTSPTFAEFAKVWIEEKRVEWRDSHHQAVAYVLEAYGLPAFGDKKLSEITKADVLQFRANLAKEPLRKGSPLKATTINKTIAPIRMILNEAAERYEFTSPFRGIKSLKAQRVDVQPFSLDEVNMILANVRRDFHAYFTVRFFTGMRTGEGAIVKSGV